MVKKKKITSKVTAKKIMNKKPDKTLAIIGLIVNIFIIPGLGSIIGGRTKTGIWQIVLTVISIPLMLIIIGFLLAFVVWIWGIVTGVQMIQQSA